eukprot:2166472-Rhodomonas_salina.1
MIHNLFDEYRFFPRYPERELLITGKLFGSLIQHQLVSSITLGIALRYVLEALRKPLRSNMFKFGMCALEQVPPISSLLPLPPRGGGADRPGWGASSSNGWWSGRSTATTSFRSRTSARSPLPPCARPKAVRALTRAEGGDG